MIADAFLRGAIAGLGIAVPVGAIALLIIETGRRWRFRAGAAAGLGAALADLTYAAVAGGLGASVAHILSTHTALIHWISGGVLGVLAVLALIRALSRPSIAPPSDRVPPGSRLTLTFLGLTLANPLTVTYFAALVAGSGKLLGGFSLVPFVIGVFVASLSWQWLLAAVGAFLGARFSARSGRLTGVLGSLIIAGMAVRVVLGT